jgi:hypothetical protein
MVRNRQWSWASECSDRFDRRRISALLGMTALIMTAVSLVVGVAVTTRAQVPPGTANHALVVCWRPGAPRSCLSVPCAPISKANQTEMRFEC